MLRAVAPLLAQPTGPAPSVVVEHADLINTRIEGGEQIIEAIGSVRARQGQTEISASRALVYQPSNRVVLTGSVRVSMPGTVLTAPRADYDGNTRLATTPAGVVIQDGDATIRANSATYDLYSRRATFAGGVTLSDPRGKLEAASGEYYSVEKRGDFHGGVKVVSDSGTITARDITYWRDTEETLAEGSVVVIPRDRDATLSGDRLRHMPRIGYSIVTGSAKLVDVDTVEDAEGRRDTSVITAAKLEAYRSEKHSEYIATDSVRMRRGALAAMAHAAYYIPDDEVIALGSGRPRTAPEAPSRDTAAVTGRSHDTLAADTTNPTDSAALLPDRSPERFQRGEYPVVWYEESQMTGDTITVSLSRKALKTIDVDGDAMTVSAKKGEPGRYDQLAADRIIFDIDQDTIRHVRSIGSASILSFLDDNGKPNGVSRNSAERITMDFAAGKLSEIAMIAGAVRGEGETFPESMVAGAEGSYRLEGFRWVERPAALARLTPEVPKAPKIPEVRDIPE